MKLEEDKKCVDCNEKINGLQLELETGRLAKVIEDVLPALGKGIGDLLNLIDIEINGRILGTGVKVGLENTKNCNPDLTLTHRATFGFFSCD